MSIHRTEMRVRRDEGSSLKPYQDILGIWSTGYGSTEIFGKPVTADTPHITTRQALTQLKADLWDAQKAVEDIFPELDIIQEVRREVLINMAYNLGKSGLFKFFRLRMAVSARDWSKAAKEIEDSKYFRQVGRRGVRLRNAMRRGSWDSLT